MESLISVLPDIQNLGTVGYWFVFLFSLGESVVFTGWIVPGTLFLVVMGGFAAHGFYDIGDLMLFAVIGAILGDGISYELGRRWTDAVEHHSFFSASLRKGKSFFHIHKGKSVVLGRFVGPIRPIIPFVAGLLGMGRAHFYTANIFSAIGWSIVYIAVGYFFGAAWKIALVWFDRVGLLLLGLLILGIGTIWLWRWTVQKGKHAMVIVTSIGYSIWVALQENPYIHSWLGRHARLVSFIRQRFSTERFTGLPLSILIVGMAYSTALLSGVIEDYLTGDPLIMLDTRLANFFLLFRTPPLLRFFYVVTLLAEIPVVIALSILLTIVLWMQRHKLPVIALWIAVIGSNAITMMGKLLFHRVRPEGLLPAVNETSFSFPSGHATSAVTLYGFCIYLVVRFVPSWKKKITGLFAGGIIIMLIDVSRLYLGVHYLSDVLASNLVGLIVLFFAISTVEWIREKQM